MTHDSRFSNAIFPQEVLREAFPHLDGETCSDVALAPLFDVLCWQIRLQLLSHRSIYRIERPVYDKPENRYRILAQNGGGLAPVARVSFRYSNVNRTGYGDLDPTQRDQLPDRGIMPPPALFMMSAIVIEGDIAYTDRIYNDFNSFLQREMREVDVLRLLMRFARERLADQAHAWLALQADVADFHSITGPA